jgi:prepilin-type N-terminal cleavage/methylation domain-containing protein/prepilin-type processing-associated H-X9-DG protein
MSLSNNKKLFYKQSRKAFTLVELLVVIAILALLLAVMLPSLRAAKEAAKSMVCKHRLGQLAIAWNVYLIDYKGKYYQAVNADHEYGGWKGLNYFGFPEELWPDRPLNAYVDLEGKQGEKDRADLFCCPSDKGGVWNAGYAITEKAFHIWGTSYRTNMFLIGQSSIPNWGPQYKDLNEEIREKLKNNNLKNVCNPSRLLLIGDNAWFYWMPHIDPDDNWRHQGFWHDKEDHYNMSFMDGHVEFVEITEGYYVGDKYYILPFSELHGLARQVQGE